MKTWRRSAVLVSSFSLLGLTVVQAGGAALADLGSGRLGHHQGATLSLSSTAPTSATDATKVPHYFGPWPNWALSPLVKNNATVTIAGDGTGAEASATLDPVTGGVVSVDVTSRGHGYTTAPSVTITGGTTDATAHALVNSSGGVTRFTVTTPGTGYSGFDVALAGGGGAGATAVADGGVDAVQISDGGLKYSTPVVEFGLPDDPNGTVAKGHVPSQALDGRSGLTADGTVTEVVVDDAGSGYYSPPPIAIHNGTVNDPVVVPGFREAALTATLKLTGVSTTSAGSGYTSAPTVTITDPTGTGTGAAATASTNAGFVTEIVVDTPGAGYLTGGIKKFQQELPKACVPGQGAGCPSGPTDKFIPVAVPENVTYNSVASDQYVIAVVQYQTSFSPDLPLTTVRGYVQVETPAVGAVSQHVALTNTRLDGTKVPVLDANGDQVYGVTAPQWLGPFIMSTKDRPTRVIFHNYLPKGAEGDLFLPVDSSMMGSGMGPQTMTDPVDSKSVLDEVRNPACTQSPKDAMCFTDNRATLHLHGGITPWISDGTPHQWITPAGESTQWPQGVSVGNVPDMNVCQAADDGCQTFYYTNQQSARLMFYHDHAWGITRLNVYAGEAAGYAITDATEQRLVDTGTIPGPADTLPLIVQDRTFVPDDSQLYDTKDAAGNVVSYGQDPTWDAARWGGKGSFWYHHVYMPAQNPGDPSGMSSYGRWMYGAWFYPPAADLKYGPIDNPYYDPACHLDVPSTWQYQTDPFCEPAKIPGTPNISAGMEQFNDTPIVNGVAYPKTTVEPKTYRLRMLNAANDRFFNFQWYVADPTQGNGKTEVALKPYELAQAQRDPNVSPTPVHNADTAGPDWIQIGSEGGFLPAPTVIDGQQETTWVTDPTRFDFGNVDQHSLFLAPAERADVIVDFSKYAGKTLILYNDAPAAVPARVASYDYYTGAPDLSPNGAPSVLPGYGPNTRTIMQVTVAPSAPAPAFNLTKLQNAFKHQPNGSGVFESSQHPIIVGQAAYNSAYGSSFAAAGDCSTNVTAARCEGYVRIGDTSSFSFNTLRNQTTRQTIPLQPKAIHDEMNATNFDEFGRMQANLGVESGNPQAGQVNATLYPYVNPQTELIDGTNLPKDDNAVTPIASLADGTQIWRISHNGVDTHPVHFHLYDVQLINRVTWDNIVIPPDANELGWKDTVRVSPLEDTIVALRPVVPKLPFEIPNSIRRLNPMMPDGSTAMFNPIDINGQGTSDVVNQLVNFGWEYVYHCHILSHEEMDMMRPVSLVLPPLKPDGLTRTVDPLTNTVTISWNDNSITETSFVVQRSDTGAVWTDIGTVDSPLNAVNGTGVRSLVDVGVDPSVDYQYRVVAKNTVGYGGEYPSMTAQSVSDVLSATKPAAPSGLTAVQDSPPALAVKLSWTDNANNETGYAVERSANGGVSWGAVGTTLPADATTMVDTTVERGVAYSYRAIAVNAFGQAVSNVATITLVKAPADLSATAVTSTSVRLTWTDSSTVETGYDVQRSVGGAAFAPLVTLGAVAGVGSIDAYVDPSVPTGTAVTYRVVARNGADYDISNVAGVNLVAAPTGLAASPLAGPAVLLTWNNNSTNETGFYVRRSADNGATWTTLVGSSAPLAPNTATYTDSTVTRGKTYLYQVAAVNSYGMAWSNSDSITIVAAPSGLTAVVTFGPVVNLGWTDVAVNESAYRVQRSSNGGVSWTTLTTPDLLANAQAFDDRTVVDGSGYTYRVGAINGPDIAWSGSVSVTVLSAPTDLRAQLRANPTNVRLTFTDRSAFETGYSIQRSEDNGATWAQVATRAAASGTGTVLSVTDSSVLLGTTYLYRVAPTKAGTTAYSNVVGVVVDVPAAPTTVAGSAASVSRTAENLTITWSDLPNETAYRVQWSQDATVVTGSASKSANVTSHTVRVSKRLWYVRVQASNVLGSGPWSGWVAVPAAP